MVITGNIPGVTSGGGWVCSMSRGNGYVHGMGGVYPELHGPWVCLGSGLP